MKYSVEVRAIVDVEAAKPSEAMEKAIKAAQTIGSFVTAGSVSDYIYKVGDIFINKGNGALFKICNDSGDNELCLMYFNGSNIKVVAKLGTTPPTFDYILRSWGGTSQQFEPITWPKFFEQYIRPWARGNSNFGPNWYGFNTIPDPGTMLAAVLRHYNTHQKIHEIMVFM